MEIEDNHVTKTTSILLGIIFVVHIIRVLSGWEAIVSGWQVPMWISYIAIVLAGYLSYRLWNLKQ